MLGTLKAILASSYGWYLVDPRDGSQVNKHLVSPPEKSVRTPGGHIGGEGLGVGNESDGVGLVMRKTWVL